MAQDDKAHINLLHADPRDPHKFGSNVSKAFSKSQDKTSLAWHVMPATSNEEVEKVVMGADLENGPEEPELFVRVAGRSSKKSADGNTIYRLLSWCWQSCVTSERCLQRVWRRNCIYDCISCAGECEKTQKLWCGSAEARAVRVPTLASMTCRRCPLFMGSRCGVSKCGSMKVSRQGLHPVGTCRFENDVKREGESRYRPVTRPSFIQCPTITNYRAVSAPHGALSSRPRTTNNQT